MKNSLNKHKNRVFVVFVSKLFLYNLMNAPVKNYKKKIYCFHLSHLLKASGSISRSSEQTSSSSSSPYAYSRGHGQDGQDGHDSQDGHDHLTGPFQGSDREDSYHQLAYVPVGYQ